MIVCVRDRGGPRGQGETGEEPLRAIASSYYVMGMELKIVAESGQQTREHSRSPRDNRALLLPSQERWVGDSVKSHIPTPEFLDGHSNRFCTSQTAVFYNTKCELQTISESSMLAPSPHRCPEWETDVQADVTGPGLCRERLEQGLLALTSGSIGCAVSCQRDQMSQIGICLISQCYVSSGEGSV